MKELNVDQMLLVEGGEMSKSDCKSLGWAISIIGAATGNPALMIGGALLYAGC